MSSVIDAILSINPSAVVTVHGNQNLDTCEIIWLEGTTPISKEDIKTEMDKL